MQVKVGDTIYDGKEQAVMVILNDADKRNLKNMFEHYPDNTKYCEYPDEFEDQSDAFMEID